jgi:single-strand DNA-binding protein
MANEAFFAVTGFIATQPISGKTRGGTPTLWMRVGWTPRVIDRKTGEWTDQLTSFVSVTCYRKVAENGAVCLRRGDPIMLKGTLQVREYADQAGAKRTAVEVVADNLSHDMSRGISNYSKAAKHAEQTAAEYQQSMAAEREPLPGDLTENSSGRRWEPRLALAGEADDEPDIAADADDADDADEADEADEAAEADQVARQAAEEPVGALA